MIWAPAYNVAGTSLQINGNQTQQFPLVTYKSNLQGKYVFDKLTN
jgi:hypothetical protein